MLRNWAGGVLTLAAVLATALTLVTAPASNAFAEEGGPELAPHGPIPVEPGTEPSAPDLSLTALPITLDLPYAPGQGWSANGPHSHNLDAGTRNSVDLSGGDGRVRAPADGIVRVQTCGLIIIEHEGVLRTSYYHVTDIAVRDGQRVQRGDVIARTGENAGCGGWVVGTQVHFSVWTYSGSNWNARRPVALDGASVGGWTIRDGGSNFLGRWVKNSDGWTHTVRRDGAMSCGCIVNYAAPYAPTPDPGKMIRVAGANRYDTSVAVSRHGFPNSAGVSTVVIATGSDFADALSAAPLATKLGAPLLLTTPHTLPSVTATELRRLAPRQILIAGGDGAVSAALERELRSYATGSVTRLAGADRYATSLAISRYGWATSSAVFLATGTGFADALSAAPVAGSLGAPVILVPGTAAQAPSDVQQYLSAAGAKQLFIAGGTGAVSSGVEQSVRSGRTVLRYAGANRYATSALLAEAAYTAGGTMYLASGADFPDALSGAVVAGRAGAPLLLAQRTCLTADGVAARARVAPSLTVLLGGDAVLADSAWSGRACG